MNINKSTAFQTSYESAQSAASNATTSKGVRNGSRSYTMGQGFTFLVGAVAAMQGLKPVSGRSLSQVPVSAKSSIPPPRSPITKASPPPPPRSLIAKPSSPPPPPRVASPSPVPTSATPASSQPGWSVNSTLSFVRKPVTSPLLASTDLGSAANPFATPVVADPNAPYEAPHSYETCHARTPSGSTMCVQGIGLSSLNLLASGPHPLTCNDTAHVFWTVENAAWGKDLNTSLWFKNVVQFKNPNAAQCCLAYESNWNICDDIYPAQNECKDVVKSCAMLTEDAQQKILRGAVPMATGETYDVPNTPGTCGINATNHFSCLNETNFFNIPPGGRSLAPNVGTGFVPVDGSGCEVSASTGVLGGACD